MIAIGLRDSLQGQLSMPMYRTFAELGDVHETQYLVDSAGVEKSELYTFMEEHPNATLTYVVDSMSPTMSTFAAAHSIQLIEPERVVASLRADENEAKQTPILAFWGVYPRLGTSIIAMAVGHVLAEQHGKSVGMVGLNAYNPGHWMLNDTEHHLDDISSFLQHRKLDRQVLLGSMESAYRIKYLPGLRNQTNALMLQPEHVRSLIDVAQSCFDVLILDLGSILNTALALEGMNAATQRFVVANDLVSTQKQFFDHIDYVLKPLGIDPDQLLLVGNQLHGKSNSGFAKSIGLLPMAAIPTFPSIDLYAEQQPDPLKLFFAEKTFRKAAEAIASSVLPKGVAS
ncbi:hypothetical protein [Alicyclobacillus sp. ALC3]|uniref:hypothetical protein n=1 Tax=Alicyclobacillus sp. ALC3 TaxID=2796143 RepID=UPI002378AAC8|nr:hypothetical protein [Alicyclobacillus sp. ALC3]WDL99809.1 hypothetical protein JC200_23860 [Alicyclobacillus sp. ALC3]